MIRPQLSQTPGGILFLGDYPGDEEDIKGVPFIGATGHLLSRALRAANLTDPSQPAEGYEPSLFPEARRLLWERRAHSFAYVLPEQPSREVRGMLASAGPKRFAAWAQEQCVPEVEDRLGRALGHAMPNVIVTLGDLALWKMTGETSSDQWRGAPRSGWGGAKILPTYPLDRVMQQYKLFGPLIADLLKVAREAKFPEVRQVGVELWLEPRLPDLQAFWEQHIQTSDLITVDLETAVSQIVCIQFGTSATTAIVVPFVDYRKSSRSYWETEAEELAAWNWVREVLDCPVPKLLQNGTYDSYWLLERAGLTIRNYRHDTRLLHHILMPELPKSLAFMSSLYTSMNRWKSGVVHGSQAEKRRDDT